MKIFFITFILLIVFLLLLCVYFWPYFIATKKQKDEHLAIFIVNLLLPALPIIGWIITLMWAISLNDYRSEEEKNKQKDARNALWDFIVKNWISAISVIIVISILASLIFSNYNNSDNSTNFESDKINKAVQQSSLNIEEEKQADKLRKERIPKEKSLANKIGVNRSCLVSYENNYDYFSDEEIYDALKDDCSRDDIKKMIKFFTSHPNEHLEELPNGF